MQNAPTINKPVAESYWVIPDRFLAGKHPGGRNPQEIERRLAPVLAAGFDAFLDLTEPGELPAYEPYLPDGAWYARKPIPDHGTPREKAHMAEILATLDAMLDAGRRVYLHCRAGIGRTGTVVACHLIDRGLPPEQALSKLNHLWLQSDRSDTWPEVPETDDQRRYVLEFVPEPDPTRAPDVMHAARSLRDRFQGGLLGLAVGDALAVHTQFRKPGSFTAVGDILGGGPFDLPRGAWSDDTAMALLLAESLVEREGFDAQDQVQRYARWQRDGHGSATGQCVGITASVARALATAQYRHQPFAGSHDPGQLDKEPLSRVAPVVMFYFADATEAVRRSAESARITAQAPMVLDCVRLLAAMIHQALAGKEKGAVLRPPRELWVTPTTRAEVLDVYEGSYARRDLAALQAGGHVVQALEAALWAFQRSGNFREGALACANLGRDSDVVTAVYGAIAGAHFGVSSIPGIWRNSLMRQDAIVDAADRLLTRAMVTLGS